jgi:hypothetical protein
MAKIEPLVCTGCGKPVLQLHHIYPGKFQCLTFECDESDDVITTDTLIKQIYEQLLK